MAVKYLSDEYFKEVNNRVQSDEAVLNAAKGQTITIQNVLTDSPEGEEVRNWLKITDGTPEVGKGDIDSPEVTITNSYETAVGMSKGEINGQQAFMQGKLKITGNMMKVMALQGFLQAFGKATQGVDTEY